MAGIVPRGAAVDHLTEEVRLAMAWNGGVSLAIWMGGVAVELDAARRACATGEGDSRTDQIYSGLCEAFDRTLVVDILCGASAGGINAALLAAAIQAEGGALAASYLREEWIELGDLAGLLQPLENNTPKSLMQGEKFLAGLEKAFNGLPGMSEPPGSGRAKVMLDIQVTDIAGAEHAFLDDWSATFYAREYRAPVQFRRAEDYQPHTLAAAARASSSFPGAFEAQKLEGTAARLAGFPDQTRWAIDGGVLENAPIRQAIELIPTMSADGPVKRFLCYVNPEPTVHVTPPEEPPATPAAPDLAGVLANALLLPRTGRMIDQMRTVEQTRRRAGIAPTGLELAKVEHAPLISVAQGLLPTYQKRRALLSLEEILEAPESTVGPGSAQRVLDTLGTPTALAWIPTALSSPASTWRWGARAAQRVLQLELDLLISALADSEAHADADTVFSARSAIYACIQELEDIHSEFTSPSGAIADLTRKLCVANEKDTALASLDSVAEAKQLGVAAVLRSGTDLFKDAYDGLTDAGRGPLPSAALLFGAAPESWYEHFLEHALAIEVIRRSFSDDFDIEAAQKLHVAQLTPLVSTPLLAANPSIEPGPCTPEEKLTGIRLAHFSAFYRSSWRANDFMWGRLDGASHAVRILVDAARAAALIDHSPPPAQRLTEALLPAGDDPHDIDERRLITELLDTAVTSDGTVPSAAELAGPLETAIAADLAPDTGSGALTRLVVTRALQYQILVDEAETLARQTIADQAEGADSATLDWSTQGSVWPIIEQLRGAVGDDSLPRQLGRDSLQEGTSNLAARSISHAGITALAALSGVVPLARLLQPARVPLLTLQGMTARRPLDRACTAVAFTGAAWYLAARYLTMPRPGMGHPVPLGSLWSATTLALWASLLFVLGLVALPTIRALSASGWNARRFEQGFWALALAAAGGGVAIGWQWALNGTAVALTTSPAGYEPPRALLWIVAALGGFHVASQLESVTKIVSFLQRPLNDLVSTTALLAAGTGGTMAVLTMANAIGPALCDLGWKTAIAVLAIAAPLLALGYLRPWQTRPR
jgi:predicted acylesterase/phospholipase RssA